jgi:hypothetical protein
LPGDAEVVPVGPGRGLESDPAQLVLVLLSRPKRGLPLAEVATSSGTARVTPRMVRSTSPLNVMPPVRSVKRPLKVIFG